MEDLKFGTTGENLLTETRGRVEKLLMDSFPDYVAFENGAFAVSRGSTRVMIVVRSFTELDCVVECTAHVVVGATITPELMSFLLRKNAELHFGGFGLLFDNTIVFTQSITGATMDRSELITAVAATAVIADHYDDEIVAMAGGKRASDIVDIE
ncbi:MAG: YbjN domain-containing protein [Candidatus Kapabacteria bacterium]|nr:YbjN domain-containing protein [Candidatus Kapabacteria bacterium]MBX7154512.1 YbjN domain-containing protein [Bacteroidota bacterium]